MNKRTDSSYISEVFALDERYSADNICTDCCTATFDAEILSFNVTNQVNMKKVKPITIGLKIRDTGKFNPETKLAYVIGIQNGIEIYSQMISASDRNGNGTTRFKFPLYQPIVSGDIMWTAIIYSNDLDGDTAVATTSVIE